MKNILFLCTGNSCRSQMAEGWGREIWGNKYRFFSAGIKKHGLNTRAVEVMKNHGIDISLHKSNLVEELESKEFDIVFTVCSDAHETCPILPGAKIVHVGFDDPPRLTKNLVDEVEILNVYDRVCLEIKDFIENLEEYIS